MCSSLDWVLQERRVMRWEKGKGSSGGDAGLIMPPVSSLHHPHTSLPIFIIVILGKKKKKKSLEKQTAMLRVVVNPKSPNGHSERWCYSVNHSNTNQSSVSSCMQKRVVSAFLRGPSASLWHSMSSSSKIFIGFTCFIRSMCKRSHALVVTKLWENWLTIQKDCLPYMFLHSQIA